MAVVGGYPRSLNIKRGFLNQEDLLIASVMM